jgi:two-component system, LytTR family, sensor kinase
MAALLPVYCNGMKSFKQSYYILTFLLAFYAWGGYNFFKTWCTAQHYEFTNGQYLLYTLLNVVILLLPALFNYFYLIDRFEKRGYGWVFYLWQGPLLSASLWLQAGVDGIFLAKYHVPWLYTEEHVYSRFFVNLCFMLLLGFQKMIQNNFKKQEQQNRLQVAQLEANMKFLRSQISPHFLFNTLNNIYSYAVQQKKETPELILKLSGILRYLSDAKNLRALVPVEKELEAVNQLVGLYLVNTRWQPKVNWQVTDHRTAGKPLLIEPQSLLTLAENAFKHCQLDEEGAEIVAGISVTDDGLKAEISNTLAQTPAVQKEPGTGLDNLLQRLHITYQGRHRLTTKNDGRHFMVHLFLPSPA